MITTPYIIIDFNGSLYVYVHIFIGLKQT